MRGADAAETQALSITKLAEANREAGLKEAEVLRQKNAAANSKSKEILLQEAVLTFLAGAPAMLRELVKPAEKISEIKVLQFGGMAGGGTGSNGNGGRVAQERLCLTALFLRRQGRAPTLVGDGQTVLGRAARRAAAGVRAPRAQGRRRCGGGGARRSDALRET